MEDSGNDGAWPGGQGPVVTCSDGGTKVGVVLVKPCSNESPLMHSTVLVKDLLDGHLLFKGACIKEVWFSYKCSLIVMRVVDTTLLPKLALVVKLGGHDVRCRLPKDDSIVTYVLGPLSVCLTMSRVRCLSKT